MPEKGTVHECQTNARRLPGADERDRAGECRPGAGGSGWTTGRRGNGMENINIILNEKDLYCLLWMIKSDIFT